jgi:DNA-binding CsgD family transcriptional regulator
VRRGLERDPEATLGWAAYFLALDAWLSEDFDTTAALARRKIEANAEAYAACSLLGWIAIKRERYAEAGGHFIESLDRLRAARVVDRRAQGNGIHAASVVAMETVNPKLIRRLEPHVAEMEWPASSAVDRFNFLTNWSTIARLEGDSETAYYRSREAVVVAPDSAYQAIGEVNLATILGSAGDEHTRLVLLRRAWELLRSRRWGAADDERRVALTAFAYYAAHDLPAEARKAMTLYQSLTAKANVRNVLHRDRRIAGSELMAAARVAEVQGSLDRARRAYEKAYEIWQSLHCDMRAALVAIDLRRLTRDATYDAAVRDVLAREPRAWFGEMLAPAQGPLAHVSRAERLVLVGLLEGKSAKAIADSLDRSVNTINNHTRQIFKAFGVNSRAAVLARCAGLGITPKTLARIA